MIQEIKDKESFLSLITENFISTLTSTISEKGNAKILLSGGSSPIELYEIWSSLDLPWEKIHIGLVDERFVDTSDINSNELLIHKHLLKNKAKNACFVGMIHNLGDILVNQEALEKIYQTFYNADYILLGMGDDGHTASIFPNDTNSELAFETEMLTAVTNSPKHPQRRLSCTPKMIQSSPQVVLMMAGEKKRKIFHNSKKQNLPISKISKYIHKTFILL